MLRIEQLKSLPEKLRLTPLARRKLGAIATAATLLSPIGAIPAKEISLQRYYSVAESTQPLDVNELLAREQQYPADSSAEDSLKVIDHETSSDVAIQFRYEDL
ncbi:hypothetical protein CYG49_02460, partial [Candidatus Saccharibacteria bacterium]